MIRYIISMIFATSIFANIIQTPLITVDETNNEATIQIDKIDVGMSGFISHKLSDTNSIILKNITVKAYDKDSKIATISISDYTLLENDSLPTGKWQVAVGDSVVLAYGYARSIIIAPSEKVYYAISKATGIEMIHPDIFSTILSMNSHPTPLYEDFKTLCDSTTIGIIFFYIDSNVYTVDSKSFKILNISNVALQNEETQVPFYSRIEEIVTHWYNWGEGTNEIEDYNEYYYSLLMEYNPDNLELKNYYDTKTIEEEVKND